MKNNRTFSFTFSSRADTAFSFHSFLRLLPVLLLSVIVLPAFGQERAYRRFATQEVRERLMAEQPAYRESRRNIERQTAQFQKKGRPGTVSIPVLFHIVYNGKDERISEDQVQSQLEALKRDFGPPPAEFRHPADSLEGFADRAADPGIEFCLAAVTMPGSSTPGIHYVRSENKGWKTDDAIKSAKTGGADVITPENILNVWVTRLEEGVSGYAQMPGGPLSTDGIVIDYRFFGMRGTALAPYDEGKTLTHLLGNYLGLFDIWGDGSSHCSDDDVEDTPIHNAPNFRCAGYKHVSTCPGNPVEMTMNFMDNTDDACMYIQSQTKTTTPLPPSPTFSAGKPA